MSAGRSSSVRSPAFTSVFNDNDSSDNTTALDQTAPHPSASSAAAVPTASTANTADTRSSHARSFAAVAPSSVAAGSGEDNFLHPRAQASGTNLSSSFRQYRQRSFASTSYQASDPAHYSSHGVREQTQELASWALAGSGPVANTTSPLHTLHAGRSSRPYSESHASTVDGARRASKSILVDQQENSLPDLVEEEAIESGNDDDRLDSERPRSRLTDMFRQAPQQDVGGGKEEATPGDTSTPQSTHGKPRISIEQVNHPSETTSLLPKHGLSAHPQAADGSFSKDVEGQANSGRKHPNQFVMLLRQARHRAAKVEATLLHPSRWSGKAIWEKGVKQPIGLIPCVFLGLLLNVLDALSYGMILFPLGEPIFEQTGADGLSMFYLSCIVSQLVFSCGGSIFKGAVGSEMIEVVPFFHKMAYTIIARVGTSDPNRLMATVVTAYAASAIMTGIVFFLLGACKLGSLVSFFPRHILIGCIGGVGFFLFVTGIEVSAQLNGNLNYDLETLKALFQKDTAPLWAVPCGLAILLVISKRFTSSPLLVPSFFIGIAVVFYIVVLATPSLNITLMRSKGWIFSKVAAGVPFYHFYSYYDFQAVDWKALGQTVPSMLALTFFGVLHVPINVPALGIAAEEDDLNLNRELVAHGISNTLSGCIGSVQNYLVYVNSDMFIHNGGNNRLAGLLLAAATFAVWVAGPAMIGYVPIMVVGSLIFYLGIELLEEAVYDTIGKMTRLEYLTVVAITLVMGIYDFVAGVLLGIVLACLNYVVQTSRKSAIRATYSGEVLESTVRRHPIQRHFLHEVGDQIYVTKLAGFLFFGSIVQVEKQSRALIEGEDENEKLMRYLVFDLAHVNGIDYSAAEAFTRMYRILGRRNVEMIVSGVDRGSEVAKALRSVGLWSDVNSIEFFEDLNMALEYCENEMLKAFYKQQDFLASKAETDKKSLMIPKLRSESGEEQRVGSFGSFGTFGSPRQRYLKQAATSTLDTQRNNVPQKWQSFKQPLALLLQTFQELTKKNEDFWFQAVDYFEKVEISSGESLYFAGDPPNGFYLLEQGMLRAEYELPAGSYHERIVAGTTCGELPFFSDTLRTATVTAEADSTLWMMDEKSWERMRQKWPDGASELLEIALKLTKERVDAVTGYVLAIAG